MNLRTLLTITLLIAAVAGGYWLSPKLTQSDLPEAELRAATVLPMPIDLPSFALHDQFENDVDAGTFRGQWHLLFFGFTHCPDICPATLQVLNRVQQQLAEAGMTIEPRIALVSVDPERDTPETMGQYVNYFGDGNLGITGELAQLQKLTGGLGIFFAKQPLRDDSSAYSVDHSTAVLLLNPEGQFHALFSGSPTIEDYVHDLAAILPSAPLVASRVRIFEALPGSSMSVGYLTLTNNSPADIELTGVTSEQFASVELHETITQDGVAKMRPLPSLVVPARSSVELSSGGIHMMLRNKRGDDKTFELQLQANGNTTLTVSGALASRSQ